MAEVLELILERQGDGGEYEQRTYVDALKEIREDGEKSSHWIWWVWPTMLVLRETSRPEYQLTDRRTMSEYVIVSVGSQFGSRHDGRARVLLIAARKHLHHISQVVGFNQLLTVTLTLTPNSQVHRPPRSLCSLHRDHRGSV
jgi:hypothetical protein